jgi:AcrR family transcriptional regulator
LPETGYAEEVSPQQEIQGADVAGGLRERKKWITRRLISDTATALFLKDGFDAVRVVDVAAACGVSEKTVYNYFPTKESLILDRFEAMETDAQRIFGPEATSSSPVEAAVAVIIAEVEVMFGDWGTTDKPPDPALIRRFAELLYETPALRAAQWEMFDRMGRVAAVGLARRAGVGPDEPEPRIAAVAILGLWRIPFGSMVRHATPGRTAVEVRDAVMSDVRRAANVIDAGLRSFGWEMSSGHPPNDETD